MSKLHHPDRFKHVDYGHTNLKATFARIRKQQADTKLKQQEADMEARTKIVGKIGKK